MAYCAYYDVSSFVTREKAILRSGPELKQKFNINVTSVEEFTESEIYAEITRPGITINESNFEITTASQKDFIKIENFLKRMSDNGHTFLDESVPNILSQDQEHLIASTNGLVIGYACWDKPHIHPQITLNIIIDESLTQAEILTDYFLACAFNSSTGASAKKLILKNLTTQPRIDITAGIRGFLRDTNNDLVKITKPGVVTQEKWQDFRNEILALSGWKLPQNIPNSPAEHGANCTIETTNHELSLKWGYLEELFSPLQIITPERSAIIVPIRKWFSDLLFDFSRQKFLPIGVLKEASVRLERAYFRSRKSASIFEKGDLILFYESSQGKGRKAIIGSARLTSSAVLHFKEVAVRYSRQGVFEQDKLEETADTNGLLHIFTFDNILPAKKAVSFNDLGSICPAVKRTNLQLPQKINPKELNELIKKGFS